jgi:hypothetical protein
MGKDPGKGWSKQGPPDARPHQRVAVIKETAAHDLDRARISAHLSSIKMESESSVYGVR